MRPAPLLLIALVLAGCAAPTRPTGPFDGRRFAGDGPPGQAYANPSKLLVAEIAFARMAREEGQWTAFRETAAEDAIMFAPQPVFTQSYLAGRADPPAAVAWQPHELFISCDGRTGATTGAWQRPDGSTGYYTTVWQNFAKPRDKDDDWHWLLDHGDTLSEPLAEGDMVSSRTASCAPGAKAAAATRVTAAPSRAGGAAPTSGTQASADGSFLWSWSVEPDGARNVSLEMWNGKDYDPVLINEVAAEAP